MMQTLIGYTAARASIAWMAQLQLLALATHRVACRATKARQLRIAGLGGIIGRPDKPNRLPAEPYLQSVRKLLEAATGLLACTKARASPSLGLVNRSSGRPGGRAGDACVQRAYPLGYALGSTEQRHTGSECRQQAIYFTRHIS